MLDTFRRAFQIKDIRKKILYTLMMLVAVSYTHLYRPYTPSRRQMTGSDFSEITKKSPEKSLLATKTRQAGRNNQGKITVRHRGGGAKKKYRIVDFKRRKDGISATVLGIEYDPNRTANIALICYEDGEKAYILAPEGLTDGMKVMNGPEAEVRVGNCLPLSEIPVGTQIHNIELHPGKGGQMVQMCIRDSISTSVRISISTKPKNRNASTHTGTVSPTFRVPGTRISSTDFVSLKEADDEMCIRDS